MAAILTDEKIEINEIIDELLGKRLIVHNDHVNTFEHVIENLVYICGHTYEQAEQCAFIIHYKGKYAVKEGSDEILNGMRRALVDKGIQATLE